MPRIRFKVNPHISEPYVHVSGLTFSKYGDVEDVDLSSAIRLVETFPYAFGSLDELPSPPPQKEARPETIRLRFLSNSIMPSYVSAAYSFHIDGEELDVEANVGNRLLSDFPDNFAIVLNDEEQEVESESIELETESEQSADDQWLKVERILQSFGKEVTAKEIAEKLAVTPSSLYFKLHLYATKGLLVKSEGEGGKLYSLP